MCENHAGTFALKYELNVIRVVRDKWFNEDGSKTFLMNFT